MEIFPADLRAELWEPEFVARPRPAAELLGAPDGPGVDGLQRLDVRTYLPGDLLVKADIASMAHSLELRSPLLDHRVLELGLSLPDRLKLSGRQGKVALRQAFAEQLPPEVAGRGKTGFGVPLTAWFRGELRPLAADLLLDATARGRGQLRPAAREEAPRRACLRPGRPRAPALVPRDARALAAHLGRHGPACGAGGRLLVTRRWAYAIVVAAAVVPRLVVLLHERGSILADNTEKSDSFATTFVHSGTYGFIPGDALGLDAARLLVLPDPRLLDLRTQLAGRRPAADRARGSDRADRLRDRQAVPVAAGGADRGGDRDAESVSRLARRPRQPRDRRPVARGRDRLPDAARGGADRRPPPLARRRARRRPRARDPRATRGCSSSRS